MVKVTGAVESSVQFAGLLGCLWSGRDAAMTRLALGLQEGALVQIWRRHGSGFCGFFENLGASEVLADISRPFRGRAPDN